MHIRQALWATLMISPKLELRRINIALAHINVDKVHSI